MFKAILGVMWSDHLKITCNLKPAGYRAITKMWDSRTLVKLIWGTFDFKVFNGIWGRSMLLSQYDL